MQPAGFVDLIAVASLPHYRGFSRALAGDAAPAWNPDQMPG
jgi:hypothetical protein